ncbi:MAG: cation:proton antiporter family protein [Patescibacteria group bacterium]
MGVFETLAVMLCLCAVFGFVARKLSQPTVIGYLIAGMVFSAVSGDKLGDHTLIETLGKMGVTLLLFLAGMELPIAQLQKIGKVAVVTGLTQVMIVGSAAYALAWFLGFSQIASIYIGLGLTFGSTIIVIKLLSERGELQSLHGKIATGYLLVQDFVAVAALSVLGIGKNGVIDMNSAIVLVLKVVGLFCLAALVSRTVMPKFVRHLAGSVELLFVSAIGWCLLLASAVSHPTIGLSFEIGGFLAGITLASAVEHAQIIARVRPVRDFFVTWFFVAMGAGLSLSGILGFWPIVLIFTLFVVLGSPGIVFGILMALGYKRRTAFLSAVPVGQVSEFSLILAAVGVKLGAIPPEIVAILTMTAMLTMAISVYVIGHAKKIYRLLWKEQGGERTTDELVKKTGHIVLFGHNRVGSVIRPMLKKMGFEVVVVDFDPEIIDRLKEDQVIYGDMSDHELYDRLDIQTAAAVISTVVDVQDSLLFLLEVKRGKKVPLLIVTAADAADAKLLYQVGADYVLVPHAVGGEYLSGVFEELGAENLKNGTIALGKKHKERLGLN